MSTITVGCFESLAHDLVEMDARGGTLESAPQLRAEIDSLDKDDRKLLAMFVRGAAHERSRLAEIAMQTPAQDTPQLVADWQRRAAKAERLDRWEPYIPIAIAFAMAITLLFAIIYAAAQNDRALNDLKEASIHAAK